MSTRSLFVVLVLASSCAASPSAPTTAPAPTDTIATVDPKPACDRARDREAIVAMAGDFRVSFDFEETEVSQPGYERHAPYHETAREVVVVVEDTPQRIGLQHVLIIPGTKGEATAMRHWRQDWIFEDRDLVEYAANGEWQRRTLATNDVACTWSQAVYGVVDEPRYESFGRWAHDADASTWTSHETWRPLPRREHTKRKDYDVLVAINRHVVTKTGWVHEQDNSKLVLATKTTLVREKGANRYGRSQYDEAAIAHAYLRDTDPFWKSVRASWDAVFANRTRFVVCSEIDGKPLYEHLFALADPKAKGEPAARAKTADALLRRCVTEINDGAARAPAAARP
jgi:hypothetical protein